MKADELFAGDEPAADASLEGRELSRAYWRVRALREELDRKERYWTQICDALGNAYDELERMRAQLEQRVDGLHRHLATKVDEDSTRLLAFANAQGAATRVEPGTVLNGRTHVLEPLGQGGSGAVYAARDVVLGGSLAVKVLRRPDDRAATLRFLAEVQAGSRVSHASVVQPLHVDVSEGGLPWVLMERVEGRSLHAQLRLAGALAPRVVCSLGAVLARALAAAHDAGLVHRDVKPGNLMISAAAPGLRVLDFGLAGAALMRGGLLGTPAYVAPEQIADASSAGPAADVYSAGATLFEACTGRPPFSATSTGDLLKDHVSKPAPVVDGPLSELIAACLEKRPESRPTSLELATRLEVLAVTLHALPAHEESARLLAPVGDETSQ